jgi:Zn-dependent protease with chaperone function
MYLPSVQRFLERRTIAYIEDQFGSDSIPTDQETKIRQIAKIMGVTDEMRIRKMNDNALVIFDYHNALFIPSNLWGFLPLVDIPCIYVSTGFLEDLSSEEQQFLIGHELIHLRDRHTRFLGLLYYLFIFAVIFVTFFIMQSFIKLYSKLLKRFTQPIELHYFLQALQACIITIFFFTAILLPELGVSLYRRHLERCADLQSVALINSHHGGIAFLNRCIKEWGHCAEWNWWQACILHHPSHTERKKYILAHQQKNIDLHS